MIDYHLMYNELMDKTNAIFAEDDNIRSRIHRIIGFSPMQIVERKDEQEMIVRETSKKFQVVCRFFRDFIERNYVSRVKPFRSYSGILEAYDLIDRFMKEDLGAIAMEAVIAISMPGEKAPLRNLMRMLIFDDQTDEKMALKRLVIFISALEAAKKYQESKGDWSSDDQSLSEFYAGAFMDVEMSDMEKMDEMLIAIRNEESYRWYLHSVIYPLIMQKFGGCIFEIDEIKSDSWRKIWELLKRVPSVDGETGTVGQGKYALENEDTIQMIIRDALVQYRSGTLYTYHPMWLFGSRLYWDVLNDYYRMFQQDFELYQIEKMMEAI
jgi:hypothetical protein